MTSQEISRLLQAQRAYYKTGATLPVKFRITQLKKLYVAVQTHQDEICKALESDLGKSTFESFMCEVGMVLF